VVTVIGLQVANLLSGTVIIEQIFNLGGEEAISDLLVPESLVQPADDALIGVGQVVDGHRSVHIRTVPETDDVVVSRGYSIPLR
jgi:hypothetical protein